MGTHRCPTCGHSFSVPDWLTTEVKCPSCRSVIAQNALSRWSPRQLVAWLRATLVRFPSLRRTGWNVRRKTSTFRSFAVLWLRKHKALAGLIAAGLAAMVVGAGVAISARMPHASLPARGAADVTSDPAKPPQAAAKPASIYDRALRSTVWILSPESGGSTSCGSGALVDRDLKLVATNEHVVDGRPDALVFFPCYDEAGQLVVDRDFYIRRALQIAGKVLLADPKRDLALIQLQTIPDNVVAFPLARQSAQPSQPIHTVGNPGSSGGLWVYTFGTVRQVYDANLRTEEGRLLEARVVETQNPINPGDSGGPVINDQGELVAVVQSCLRGGNLISICVDVEEIRRLLARLPPR